MSLRLRLTLVSTAVLSVVLVAFGIGLYALLNRSLHSSLDATLRERAVQVARVLQGPFSGGQMMHGFGFGRPDTFVQIVDTSGTVLAKSESLSDETLAVDRRALSVAQGKSDSYFEDAMVREVPLRVLVGPMVDQFDRPAGAVLVAAPSGDVPATLGRMRRFMMLVGAAGLLLAGWLSWRAARTALRPVEEVAEAAEEIGRTTDLSRRVTLAGHDELGRLTGAFNEMLARLERAQAELERTLDSERRFLADASHELRTPITTMRGNLEVIRRDPSLSAQDRAAALADSLDEAERMSRLVEDLLALARADARAPRAREELALSGVVKSAVDAVADSHSGTGRAVALFVPQEVSIAGEPDMLRRLFANLLDNACKYTPPEGSVEVRIGRDGPWATVAIADTGIGMSPDEVAHAFDRFWRSDASRGERGSGLGLAIAKAVAEEHGGRIELTSQPGKGTTLTVRLPALDAGTPEPPG